MTGLVFTIHMGITRFTTLMALCNDVIRNTFASSMIEYEIFTYKFVFQILFLRLTNIFDDTTFQLVNIFKFSSPSPP